MTLQDIQDAIRAGYSRVGSHAIQEATADALLITEIWSGILGADAEIIEDYSSDPRGPTCLIYCQINGMPVHVVVAYPSNKAAAQQNIPVLVFMITCYRPGGPNHAHQWSADFKKRLP